MGRRSGRRYAVVLKVVGFDPLVPEYVVVSGFGSGADWLRNVEAARTATVTVGRSTFPADARRLGTAEAVTVFAAYEQRNRMIGPLLRRVLSWLLRWPYDGSPTARPRMAQQLPWSPCARRGPDNRAGSLARMDTAAAHSLAGA